ncbi:MAG: hypothetical protein AVDCRST_MAG93-4602, partial [uncultured Chloroflexia bacterium]
LGSPTAPLKVWGAVTGADYGSRFGVSPWPISCRHRFLTFTSLRTSLCFSISRQSWCATLFRTSLRRPRSRSSG